MDFKKEQEKFDAIKWYDSIVAGEDRCGSYDFCVKCNKANPYPCAYAAYEYAFGEAPSDKEEVEACVLQKTPSVECSEEEPLLEEAPEKKVKKNYTPIAVVRLRSK